MNKDFEKYLTKEEEEKINKALARSEEDFKNGKCFGYDEFKRRIRRFEEDNCKKTQII